MESRRPSGADRQPGRLRPDLGRVDRRSDLRRFPIGTYATEGAAFDAGADRVVTWGVHGVQVWTVARSSAAPVSIDDPSFIKLGAAAISPDGRLVVSTATGGGTAVIVWDAVTGRRLRVLEGVGSRYPGAAASGAVEFSRDGRLILTAQQGTRAIVWNAQTGQAVRSIDAGTGGAAPTHRCPPPRPISVPTAPAC